MSFAELPHGQIDEIFSCLGPDFFHLRLSSQLTRERSNGMDIALEILRWLCVNTTLLNERLPGLTKLGLLRIRCSKCALREKSRQMYRYRIRDPLSNSIHNEKGCLYFCCYCLLHEVRSFLSGAPGLISKSGYFYKAVLLILILRRTHRARDVHCSEGSADTHLTALLNRMTEARGFLAECLRSRPSVERHYDTMVRRPWTHRMIEPY